MRIVQGVPMSWDPVVTAVKFSHKAQHPVWSPCSRFIAIKVHDWSTSEIQILDAATLKRIRSLTPQQDYTQSIIFSAESHSLAHLSSNLEASTGWDLQTGVPARITSTPWGRKWHHPEDSDCVKGMRGVPWGDTRRSLSITYSGCGTMFGILLEHYFKHYNNCDGDDYDDNNNNKAAVIITYNVLPRASVIGSYRVEIPVAHMIWTHGECIRFAVFRQGSITIWEVGFVSEHPATEVESMPTPDNFDPESSSFLFLPPLFRLAFILKNSIFVWDAQHSKPLLSCVDIERPREMAFSSDGSFFTCATDGFEIYLWKDSPTGYALHRKLMSSAAGSTPLLSPDGRSILAFSRLTLQLWRTSDSIIPLSTIPTRTLQSTKPFTLEFSLDEPSVVVARLLDNTATVFDLKTGVPQLTINTGMEIYGLRVGGSTVVVVGEGKIVTWNLPQSNHSLNATANVNDSIWSMVFNCSLIRRSTPLPSTLISPDFNYLAMKGSAIRMVALDIYDMTTGKCLTREYFRKHLWDTRVNAHRLWFTPDGHEVWCLNESNSEGWAIAKDSESGLLKMESLGAFRGQPKVCPWKSSRGYEIVSDGWILNSNGRRLFRLPPHWRSRKDNTMWSGRFLALLHSELPEAVILEVLHQ